ncbi:hypothetical protein OR571_06095 [Psychrobacillus sp. NEAU-3TGS]|uniref:hypothetical protein n=1 Tax=Psychrobacillus sp. NEAU-3TGS TaxID=2995412 RepID=UPI00249999CB|nr:hypothetical protein [Psychrobacillus sp. NEAU-3TGS]MDI2586713.1 hypothetical protein [Psychrobacillus sp. NEAU-3TGS]
MEPILIEETPAKVTVKYDSVALDLPESIKEQHDKFWNDQIKINSHLRNGEVFTITKIKNTAKELQVTVAKTDYKHYLYTIRHKDCPFPCKVIFTCVAVITTDNYIAFGRMNEYTSTPGRLQFTGGGLDETDLNGSVFDLKKSIGKELEEEMGLHIESSYVKSFAPRFLKSKGAYDFWAVMFELKVDYTSNELRVMFDKHNRRLIVKGEHPEFEEFVFVLLEKADVLDFIENDHSLKEDYLNPILMKYVRN